MDLHISTKKNNVHAILYTSNKQMELFYKRTSHLRLPMVRDKKSLNDFQLNVETYIKNVVEKKRPTNLLEELCNFHCVYEYESHKKSHYEHISNFLYKATGYMNACKHYIKQKLMELTFDFYAEDWSNESCSDSTLPTIQDAPPETIVNKFMENLNVGEETWSINIGHDWTHF